VCCALPIPALLTSSIFVRGQAEAGGIRFADATSRANEELLSVPSIYNENAESRGLGLQYAVPTTSNRESPSPFSEFKGDTDACGIAYASVASSDGPRRPKLAADYISPVGTRLPPVAVEQPLHDPIHILIVDDLSSIRLLMRRVLTQQAPAAVISEAADGEAAYTTILSAKESGSPLFSQGIICMDKEMPHCDGFLATKRIRAIGFGGLILGITGNAIAEDIRDFLDSGADVVITKPITVHALMSHIRAFSLKLSGLQCP